MQLPYTDASDNSLQIAIPSFRLIESHLRQVRELVDQNLTDSTMADEIKPLLDYSRSRTGKMLRPGLLLLSGGACGNITDEHIHVAAIVEMIHHATLFHDDVIDDGQLRRGLPSANSIWGNESAVLLGDYVLGRVFQTCADLEPTIVRTIATIALRVCEGELRQIIQRQNWQLREEEYIEIITEKSAAFFSGCCRLGALLIHAKEEDVEALTQFGLNAGIAFQITDDLLDITGEESRTGKTVGSDASTSKLTLAVIHLLKTIDETERHKLQNMLDAPAKSQNTLSEMLKTHHSLEYARDKAQQFITKAVETLQDLAQSEAKAALIETARFMATREGSDTA